MKTSVLLLFGVISSSSAFAQAIYDSDGQYMGYSQNSPSGVKTIYSPQGQSLGSSQIDNGQTNYCSPNGAYLRTNAVPPSPARSNTTINTPRNIPQAPVVKGW